ncbi:MAG: RNA-directed DNA polymerase [bacterium]|nr:RNA-directed DNA polymerase [bacterium]
MKKKINNIYYKYLTFDNLLNCYNIVKKTCKNKKAINRFEMNKYTNIYNIYKSLYNKTYKPYKYTLFMIFEPKPRLVMSQTISDKIVNHFVSKYYLIPFLSNKLIYSNVATRINKGTKLANKLVIKYINNIRMNNKFENIYTLKIDISKYFYNINHKILINLLKNDFLDNDVINLIKIILNETNSNYINEKIKIYNQKYKCDIPLYKKDIGLSIGAMSSQFLAIYYLNKLDHYIKEILNCKYYIRYMDDFIILSNNKNYLKYVFKKIEKQINYFDLKVNPKSNIYNLKYGINFLEYRYKIINNKFYILYKKGNIKRINNKLKFLKKYDLLKYYKSKASYNGYLKISEKEFKMKSIEKYDYYKNNNKNVIIFIKEGVFYKTYNNDAIIMWNLFKYKINNNNLSFSINTKDKVFNYLNELNIGYLVIGNDNIYVKGNDEVYNLYNKLSNIYYDKYNKISKLNELVDNLLNKDINNYEIILNFLNKLKKEVL